MLSLVFSTTGKTAFQTGRTIRWNAAIFIVFSVVPKCHLQCILSLDKYSSNTLCFPLGENVTSGICQQRAWKTAYSDEWWVTGDDSFQSSRRTCGCRLRWSTSTLKPVCARRSHSPFSDYLPVFSTMERGSKAFHNGVSHLIDWMKFEIWNKALHPRCLYHY